MQRPSIVFENKLNRTYFLTNEKKINFFPADWKDPDGEKAACLFFQSCVQENNEQKGRNFPVILLTIFPKERQIADLVKIIENMPEDNVFTFIQSQLKEYDIFFSNEETIQTDRDISGADIFLSFQDNQGKFFKLTAEELKELNEHITYFNQPPSDNVPMGNTKVYSTGTRYLTLLGNSPLQNDSIREIREDVLEIEIIPPALSRL